MNREAKELPEQLTRFDTSPISLDDTELPIFLIAHINASLNKCKKNDEALHSQSTAQAFLSDEKKLTTLRNTLAMVGTHNLKCPNANVQICTVMESELEHAPTKGPYIHSASIHCDRLTSGSGNAAYAGSFRFLAQEFSLNGKVTSVFKALAHKDTAVTDVLQELGLSKEWLEALEQTAASCWSMPDASKAPDRLLKQVIWPMAEEPDIVITPVSSFSLTRELHQRLKSRREDEELPQWITTKMTKVGGTQPINVGPFNAELGGLYRHLYADIPSVPTRKEKKRIRLQKHSKTLFALVGQRPLDVAELLNPGLPGMPARTKRQRHNRVAAAIIAQLMAPLSALLHQNMTMTADEKKELFGHLPDHEQAWLDGSADRDQVELLKESALSALRNAQFKRGQEQNPLLDDSDNKALTHALWSWLEGTL